MRRPEVPVHIVATGSIASQVSGNAIDAFIRAEREKHGLRSSPPADPDVLLRRVYLDLIGVPPTREQLHEFLADPSDGEYRRIVERLLADPRYGERWGRHWMDVWRYSDWYGSRNINEIRYSQRNIWRWRDWIVDSLNRDKGYDEMIVEMLAGDELAPADPCVTRATGFIGRNWYKFDRNVWMFDAVEHTAQAFLGLTLRCARCHDHKYDPISQQDYYRLRAFFEPHDVRTDPISGTVEMEKDATLGLVLKDGVARVYDKQLEVPTFVFARGDNRYPDEKQRMEPGVPSAFALQLGEIRPIRLPPDSYAPYLRESIVTQKIAAAQQAVDTVEHAVNQAQTAIDTAERRLADFIDREASDLAPPVQATGTVFADHFEQPRPDAWHVVGGNWVYQMGHVAQTLPGTFPTMISSIVHPRDFMARLKYKTTEVGTIHSVGFFFDATSLGDCQAVYTATNGSKSTVQAFHRQAGAEQYPANGIFSYPIQIGRETTLDLAVRDQQLNVWINGDLALVYTMPVARRSGSFAIWTHAGTAEFYELLIDPLSDETHLATTVSEKTRSPYSAPTRREVELGLKMAQRKAIAARQKLTVARADQSSLERRVAADQARVGDAADVDSLANQAATAERQAKLAQAELDVLLADFALFSCLSGKALMAATPSGSTDKELGSKAITDAEAKLNAARKALQDARIETAKQDSNYTPIGPMYPKTSTGRRLALAQWLASPANPRSARVAVNHIWLRHFGQAIVPTVANFGMNGALPSHPELLDWLAAEFVEHGWSMKHLHRMIVLSHTYRQSSSGSAHMLNGEPATQAEAPTATDPSEIDPDNRFLWRMNPRRMESEVVRDSVLSVSGDLDNSMGGPEIAETLGQDSRRRSLYFRSTPNEKMSMLEVFDQANPNECYRRQESVMPQQSLALSNSALCLSQARLLARRLATEVGRREGPECMSAFTVAAYEQILSRAPTADELDACRRFLARDTSLLRDGLAKTPFAAAPGPAPLAGSNDPQLRAMENLVHVLFNHNDFVTVR